MSPAARRAPATGAPHDPPGTGAFAPPATGTSAPPATGTSTPPSTGTSASHPADGAGELRIADLRVAYGERRVVDGVSLTVPPGRWTAVIGPNGAGKTSLLHAVVGAVPATGRVAVGGTELAGVRPRARARRVALVPQRPVIPEAMTVRDYVLLGRTAHLTYLGVEDAEDLAVTADVIARLDLVDLADRAVRTLSGGEQQRVVLARALAQQTPVLLLDEPTSALDIGHRQQVLELVDRLRAECDLTVLAAMHDLTLAAQYADHVILLDGGRVAASGPPADVLTARRIATHFGAGVHVLTAPDGAIVIAPARDAPPEAPGAPPGGAGAAPRARARGGRA